ncbi:MAG: hypothetical protein C0478_02895 [Planctomyces sp.]|nr:hypothetical protein [Planctomyces sp.]
MSNVLFLAMAAVGCGAAETGPELGDVRGKVIQNDKPVAGVTVIFISESRDAAPAVGVTDAEGHYELRYRGGMRGSPIGPCQVQLQVGGRSEDPEKPAPPPQTYTVPENRTVFYENNIFDFDLSTLGKPSI